MRVPGDSAVRRGRRWVLAGAAGAALALCSVGPSAEATPSRAEQLVRVLKASPNGPQGAMAIEELRKINTSAGHDALLSLADSRSEPLAVLALRTLARCSWNGARSKIESVYEDTARSDFVRATALTMCCALEKQAGQSWGHRKNWVKAHVGSNQHLEDQAKALQAKLWPGEAY